MNDQRNHFFKFKTPWNDNMDGICSLLRRKTYHVYAAEDTMVSHFVYKRRILNFFIAAFFIKIIPNVGFRVRQ